MIHIIQLVMNKFFSCLKIQISNVKNLQVFKKLKFDHIFLNDTDYNNVF